MKKSKSKLQHVKPKPAAKVLPETPWAKPSRVNMMLFTFFENKKRKGTVINFLFNYLFGLAALLIIGGYWMIVKNSEFRKIDTWPWVAKLGLWLLLLIIIADISAHIFWTNHKTKNN